jgi:hypothetical protein
MTSAVGLFSINTSGSVLMFTVYILCLFTHCFSIGLPENEEAR